MRISDWSPDVCSSDLAILKQFDALKNVEIGTGPGGNENTGQYEYGTDYGFLDVEENGADCTMNSEKVTTINLDHGTSGSTPWTYTCPRNTVEAVNGAYAPLNDAHYFGHVVFDMYNDYLPTSPLTNKVTRKGQTRKRGRWGKRGVVSIDL